MDMDRSVHVLFTCSGLCQDETPSTWPVCVSGTMWCGSICRRGPWTHEWHLGRVARVVEHWCWEIYGHLPLVACSSTHHVLLDVEPRMHATPMIHISTYWVFYWIQPWNTLLLWYRSMQQMGDQSILIFQWRSRIDIWHVCTLWLT
jgi:hypothetical protein